MGLCCCCPSKEEKHPSLLDPQRKRSCTDIPFLLLFLIYWGGMFAILGYCILVGDPLRLLNGYDDYNNTCGINNVGNPIPDDPLLRPYVNLNLESKPYMYFGNIVNPFRSYAICVEECPTETLSNVAELRAYHARKNVSLCDYPVTAATDLTGFDSNACLVGTCFNSPCPAFNVTPQQPFLNRCLPPDFFDALGAVYGQQLQTAVEFFAQYDFFYDIGMDFYLLRYELLYLLAIGLGLSLVVVFLLRFVIKIMVWFIVIGVCLLALGVTGLMWYFFIQLELEIDLQETHQVPILGIEANARDAFLVYAITSSVLTLILLLVVLVLRTRLLLAVALFQEAGKVLQSIPVLLIQPFFTYLWIIVVVAYGILGFILIGATTQLVQQNEGGKFREEEMQVVSYFWWFHLIGLIWMVEFSTAMQQLSMAAAVSRWFFTRAKSTLHCTCCSALGLAIGKHLGSAALGSLIITLIKIPRYILMAMQSRIQGSENIFAKFFSKCCICCLYILEKCMKFINRNAYIVVAISGTNFCRARVKAFNTLLENVLRVAAINSVGDFVLFLAKLVVVGVNICLACYFFEMLNQDRAFGEKRLFAFPLLAVAIFTYLIADCFLSTYEMIVDTLLLCFCEDARVNDGSEEKPYFMSSSLRKYVNKSSRKMNKLDGMDKTDGPVATEEEARVMISPDGTPEKNRDNTAV